MRRIIIPLLFVLTASSAVGAAELTTEEQKTIYGIGLVISRQLAVFDLTQSEIDLVMEGMWDGLMNRTPQVDFGVHSVKSQELAFARRNAHGARLEAMAKDYINQAAKEKGAIKTPSGMVYLSLKEGEGEKPEDGEKVKVHYRGTLIDGKEVENSYKRGQPDEMPLETYVTCLREGIKMMKPGGKARMICPPELAKGADGAGVIPPNATLVFEVELYEVLYEVRTK